MPYIIQVFHTPLYDLKKTVTNDLDFILGAFFSQVISFYSYSCKEINFYPTPAEEITFNYILFSKAQEYKEQIQKIIGN